MDLLGLGEPTMRLDDDLDDDLDLEDPSAWRALARDRDLQLALLRRRYPSPQAREDTLEALTQAAGGQVVELGRSVQGRPLRAACLPALDEAKGAPKLLVCANLHGVELISTRVALGALEGAQRQDDARWRLLRQRAQLWIIPTLNPDAYALTWALGPDIDLKRGRCNARGVDLNRNYPKPGPQPRLAALAGPWAQGSDDPRSPYHRGPHPLSEPETQALDALVAAGGFLACASLHSAAGCLFPARVTRARDVWRYRRLGLAFAWAQPRWRSWPISSGWADWYTGEQEDHLHHRYGCWSICVETFAASHSARQARALGGSTLWRFNPLKPEPWVRNDVAGLAGFLSAALGLDSSIDEAAWPGPPSP